MYQRPDTPADLTTAGYRIERGSNEPGEAYGPNEYWWTWTQSGCGMDASTSTFASAEEAIEDARSDAAQWTEA